MENHIECKCGECEMLKWDELSIEYKIDKLYFKIEELECDTRDSMKIEKINERLAGLEEENKKLRDSVVTIQKILENIETDKKEEKEENNG